MGLYQGEDPIAVHGASSQRNAKILPFQRPAKTKGEAQAKPIWPKLNASVFAGLNGDVTKFESNLAAIELPRKLEEEDRQPTAEERVPDSLQRWDFGPRLETAETLGDLLDRFGVEDDYHLERDALVLRVSPVHNVYCGGEAKYWVHVAQASVGRNFGEFTTGFYLSDRHGDGKLNVAIPA